MGFQVFTELLWSMGTLGSAMVVLGGSVVAQGDLELL